MLSLREQFAQTIARGLKRTGITKASKWAEAYRVMGDPLPGKWTFNRHPWLLEMHNFTEDKIVGQKAAQMGYTEWAMNMAFFYMDVKGQDVLYVLPTSDDASDFSASRFDPALEMSSHLSNFFSNVNNVGLKRAGSSILYVRGSHSRSKLKSIPAPIMVWDEVDEMPKSSLALGEERQSGQDDFKTLMLSTPSRAGTGINAEYETTTQDHYFFKCPCCSRRTELIYPECLVVCGDNLTDPRISESHLICKECKGKLPHGTKQEWLKPVARGGDGEFVSTHKGRPVRGVHISQLYSTAKKCAPPMIVEKVMKARYDISEAQELWNSKLGLPFAAPGAKITLEMMLELYCEYEKGPTWLDVDYLTMGIDVGSVLHIVVRKWKHIGTWRPGLSINDQYRPSIIYEGTSSGSPTDFDEAYKIFMDYKCDAGVVDAEPERRAAMQFAQRLYGYFYLCDYSHTQGARELVDSEKALTLKGNRTAWLDLTLGRYKAGLIDLPCDVSQEFLDHIQEPTRVLKKDKYNNDFATYENDRADHFAHADNYAEMALAVAASQGRNETITELV